MSMQLRPDTSALQPKPSHSQTYPSRNRSSADALIAVQAAAPAKASSLLTELTVLAITALLLFSGFYLAQQRLNSHIAPIFQGQPFFTPLSWNLKQTEQN